MQNQNSSRNTELFHCILFCRENLRVKMPPESIHLTLLKVSADFNSDSEAIAFILFYCWSAT